MNEHRLLGARIVHLRASNFFGGPERQILEHARLMREIGHDCPVLTFDESGYPSTLYERLMDRNIPAARFTPARKTDVFAIDELGKLLCRNADIVCVHGYKPAIMLAALRRRFTGKILGFARGRTAENIKMRLLQTAEEWAYRLFDGIVAVSDAELSRVRQRLPESIPGWSVHNAFDLASLPPTPSAETTIRLRNELNIDSEEKVIVCAGRLSSEKGQTVLLRALNSLSSEEKVSAVFCGDGPDRDKLIALSDELGVRNRVRFVGHILDLEPYYAMMDCLVLPSLTEGLPNVILEALARMKPVIASNVGGVPEIIEHGKSGLLFEASDSNALRDEIRKILMSPTESASLATGGFHRVREHFSFEGQLQKLLEVYAHTLN